MGRIENDMSQFSENDSSLTSQVRGETFSIDLELHAEGFPFHKWESLDYCGLPALYSLTGTKTYRPNFLAWNCINGLQSANQHCSCAGVLMWSFTHTSKKLIKSENGCKARGGCSTVGRIEDRDSEHISCSSVMLCVVSNSKVSKPYFGLV